MPIGSALLRLHRVGQRRRYGSLWLVGHGGSQRRLRVCDGSGDVSRSEVVRGLRRATVGARAWEARWERSRSDALRRGSCEHRDVDERDSFYRSVLTGNSVKCPHCGSTHIWTKDEAIID